MLDPAPENREVNATKRAGAVIGCARAEYSGHPLEAERHAFMPFPVVMSLRRLPSI
jgi:hypothetical protein